MSNITPRALVLWLVVAASGVLAAQAPPTGLIVGRVVEAAKGAPVTGAIVSLTGGGLPARRVVVDPQGRFVFNDLPAGGYAIAATKAGYLPGAYGKRRADGSGHPLTLGEGERMIDATVTLWRFATVSGTVIDDADDPVSGASVQFLRRTMVAGHPGWVNAGVTARADDRGVFRAAGLMPGEYVLVVSSLIAALPMSFAELAESTNRMDGDTRGQLLARLQTNGAGGFASDISQGFATTRVGDMLLQAGAGLVSGGDDRLSLYPTVWYPSATSPAQATRVTVGPGEDVIGIDIHPVLTPTVRVKGTVMGPDGPMPYLAMRLVPSAIEGVGAEITSSLALSFTTAMTVSGADGAFTFMGVPPGAYTIRALTTPPARVTAPPPSSTIVQTADGMPSMVSGGAAPLRMVTQEPTLWASTPVNAVDADVTGVTVTMRPGLRLTGRVEFDGATAKPAASALPLIKVSMDPADGRTQFLPSAYQAQIEPAGTFYTTGLVAGRYVLRLDTPPRGWTLKSAMVGGRDICDVPLSLESKDVDGLVLTFTDRPTTLVGTVRDARTRPDENAAVLVFPADGNWTDLGASPRRLQSTRPSHTGAYAFSGLPPGTYHVVAIDDGLTALWQDPAFLKKLAAVASRITIAEGQNQTVDLATSVVR